jgi:hypothetical protein
MILACQDFVEVMFLTNWREVLWVPLAWSTAAACAVGLIIGNGVLATSSILLIVALGGLTLSFGMYGVGWLKSRGALKLMAGWVLMGTVGLFVWPKPQTEAVFRLPNLTSTPPLPPVPLVKTAKPKPPEPKVKVVQRSGGNNSPNSNFTGNLNQTGPCNTFQQGNNNTAICKPDEPTFLLTTLSENKITKDGLYETRFNLKLTTERAVLISFKAAAPSLVGNLVVWRKASPGGEAEFDDTTLTDMAPADNGIATVKLPDAETGDFIVIAHSTQSDHIVVTYK